MIVDDGSHIPQHLMVSLEHLWKAVRPGGVYVMEVRMRVCVRVRVRVLCFCACASECAVFFLQGVFYVCLGGSQRCLCMALQARRAGAACRRPVPQPHLARRPPF